MGITQTLFITLSLHASSMVLCSIPEDEVVGNYHWRVSYWQKTAFWGFLVFDCVNQNTDHVVYFQINAIIGTVNLITLRKSLSHFSNVTTNLSLTWIQSLMISTHASICHNKFIFKNSIKASMPTVLDSSAEVKITRQIHPSDNKICILDTTASHH